MTLVPPDTVAAARASAEDAGFARSCTDEVGALLAVLAAAVPAGGRVLELGTGRGVGLAWLVSGLAPGDSVEVVSVERNRESSAAARALGWSSSVRFVTGDVLEVLGDLGNFDLIFADAEGGKTTGLDLTIAALAPGGMLVVDDMDEKPDDPYHRSLWPHLRAVRERLMTDPGLRSVALPIRTGVILSACVR